MFLSADSYGAYERLNDNTVDDDDFIHEPGQRNLKVNNTSWRGVFNVVVLVGILLAIIALFGGYPLISWAMQKAPWMPAHVNATGQIPDLPSMPSLIDPDTPTDVYTRTGFDGQEYALVFSDEFNQPGRSFYPGDDPFWEAADLWVRFHQIMLHVILLRGLHNTASMVRLKISNTMIPVRLDVFHCTISSD
jgi:hypothetical protein